VTPLETVLQPTWPWPTWTAVVGLLTLGAAAYLLYRSEPTSLGRGWRLALTALRVAIFGLLIFMLGGWQLQQHRTEPAQLIVALDDSVSMSFADAYRDSRGATKMKAWSQGRSSTSTPALDRFELSRRLLEDPSSGWLKSLETNYRVKLRLVSDRVREIATGSDPLFSEIRPVRPASKLGQGVRDLLAAQEGTATAAVVVLTDGVTTGGPTLLEAADNARRQGIPLFLVGVGGDQSPRDLRLIDLLADDVAFAGDAVQVEVQLTAEGLKGQKTDVRLKRTDTNEVLATQAVVIDKDLTRIPIRLTFRPQTVGTISLVVEATPVATESDKENNQLTHVLNVNDVTIKVLFVQAYPSYEFRYLKNLLSRSTRASDKTMKAFEVTTVLQEADREHAEQDQSAASLFPGKREELFAYDVVIFGDVDPTLLGRTAIGDLVAFVEEHGGSIVFLAGPRFTPHAYRETALAQLFPFDPLKVEPPVNLPVSDPFNARLTAVGALTPACQLANNQAENVALWGELPPLFWYFELPSPSAGARILVEHPTRAASDSRPLPLIVTHYSGMGRIVFHATDETYRWARFQGTDEYYSRYWLQTLRTLSRPKLLAGQSIAELSTDRQHYLPEDEVQLRVRFRDDRTNVEGVAVTVEQANGFRQTATLRRSTENSALFTAGLRDLPSGSYRVLLTSPLLDPAPLPRTFSIAAARQEQIGVPLNRAEMEQAAKLSGGRFYNWFDADRLLRDLPRGQRVRIESLPPRPIWNSPLVAGLFIGMLAVEWLLRKRVGML
jgi:uncharacterized membrane protein